MENICKIFQNFWLIVCGDTAEKCACVSVCLWVCVCVWERERKGERNSERKKGIHWCVCVCVCVCVRETGCVCCVLNLIRFKVTRKPQNNLTFCVICIIHRTQNYTLTPQFFFQNRKKGSVCQCVCMSM